MNLMLNGEPLKTKFGNVKINNRGYYKITSSKEGDTNKLLHRLIYEDFWGVELPKEIHVHHKDGNKLNNCILNLEAMTKSEHSKLHMEGENNPFYGKHHSLETRQKISDANKGKKHTDESKLKMSIVKNTTGYFRVYKNKHPNCKQGFIWVYLYFEEGKQKRISSTKIEELKQKVLARGLEWRKIDDLDG